ncbi:MAG TPA: cyclopropane-fatty-acyl-phospholipid synthase family protein [Vicinamibacterales bacterium]|jgi:cyclopropane-fatty-acyl-phospholipid synthase|nr:cyclopropane-fatty-acyl-phospholipid synthase family protein [Vicinamibacterales bacterium]
MKTERSQVVQASTFSSREAPFPSTSLDRWALRAVQRGVAAAPIRFVLWDGHELSPSAAPVATIIIKNRWALYSWVWDPALNFGEAYMFGAVEIRGDLVALLTEIYRALPVTPVQLRWPWRAVNDIRSARENVHRHYDLGNDFYRLWLDRLMVYTCAYYPSEDATLEEAQVAKLDRICQKLRLAPGESVVEAGCGWGALAIHMARSYGARVRAFNVSSEQIAYARDRARAEHVADRVEFVEDDYRNVTGRYDAFVSIGMLEHVGLENYPTLGRLITRCLGDDGRGLLHFIGRNRPMPLNAWIRKRIFPGAYPPTLPEVFERVFEPQNLSVLDVENLRTHYARTIREWLARFDSEASTVAQMFDASFARAWRLYLAGSEAAFNAGALQLFQVVFARGESNHAGWQRVGA